MNPFKKLLKQPNIDQPRIIRSQDDLERLILFMEQHFVDEVVVEGMTIKRSIHLLPEDKQKKPQPTMEELIGFNS